VKLNFYLDVVDRREYLRKNIEKNINFEEIDRKINELSQLHDDTINNLAHIKQKYDYYELASESEKELISRVNRSVNNLKILKDDLFFDEYKESIRRYQGLLVWSAMDDFNVKAWEVDKIHRFNDKAINSILYKYKNINKIKNEIKDIDKLKYKIGRSLSNIENLEHDIITVISKYEKDIYKDIKKSLIRKKNNIEDYLIQVRVSIARMEDKRNKIKENTESNNISQSIDQYGQNSINNDAESKEHIDKGGQNKEAESLHLFSVPSLDSLDTPELQEYIK